MTVFLTPDGRAVLRRHVLPARAAPRAAVVHRACCEAVDRDLARAARGRADRRPRAVAAALAAAQTRARRSRPTGPPDDGRARRVGATLAATYDAGPGRIRRRAEVPAVDDAGAPAAPPRAHRGRRRPRAWPSGTSRRWPAAGSTTSSAAASPATRVDADWLVPHFEKMLYDNALLARAVPALVAGHRPSAGRRIAEETSDYLLRDLRTAGGRLRLGAGRRHRGRGGGCYAWTPRSWPRCSAPRTGRGRPRCSGHRGGHVRARHVDPSAAAAIPTTRSAGSAVRAGCSPRARARAAGPRRQGGRRLERPGHRGAGRDRHAARAHRPGWRRPRPRPTCWCPSTSGRESTATGWSGSARRGPQAPTRVCWRTTPTWPRACWRSTSAPARRSGWPSPGAPLDVVLAHFADGQGGFHDTADDAEVLVAPPADPGHSDPLGAGWPPRRRCSRTRR